jgi:DNA-binding CsgD family transcriptional regulator
LLHDVVRLGDPARVREPLRELAGRSQGRLVDGYARHADAAATRDPDELVDAAGQFEALGALLLAAETATAAGHAYVRAGNPRTAARLHSRSTALARRCEGARTPALLAASTTVPLTRREREVAVLAARGDTSKEIAGKLHLSIRTVDNHLQSAYTKLGVSRRADLAGALGDG